MTMKRNCVNKPLNSKKQPRVIANLQLETLRLGLSDLQFRRTVLASRHVVMLKKARQYWRWRPVCRLVIKTYCVIRVLHALFQGVSRSQEVVAVRHHLHPGRDSLEAEVQHFRQRAQRGQEQRELRESLHGAAGEPDHDDRGGQGDQGDPGLVKVLRRAQGAERNLCVLGAKEYQE